MTFDWTYVYMDMPEANADDTLDYKTELAANKTASTTWTEAESDYKISTLFEVDYNSTKWQSQEDSYVNATDDFVHEMTCRPSFKFAPVIDEVKQDGSTLTLTFDMEMSTLGIQNCKEMFALIEVFDQGDVLRANRTMENDEINQYVNQVMPSVSMTGIEELEECYSVHITYGEKNKTSTQVISNSDVTCYDGKCTLDNANVTLFDEELSADLNSRIWTFDSSVIAGKWCSFVNAQICVEDVVNSLKYCDQPNDSTTSLTKFNVTQAGSYNASNFTFSVSYTSDDGAHDEDSGTHWINDIVPPGPNSWCRYSYVSTLDATSDTLNKVNINQNTAVTFNNFCGAVNNVFFSDKETNGTTAAPVSSHTW